MQLSTPERIAIIQRAANAHPSEVHDVLRDMARLEPEDILNICRTIARYNKPLANACLATREYFQITKQKFTQPNSEWNWTLASLDIMSMLDYGDYRVEQLTKVIDETLP